MNTKKKGQGTDTEETEGSKKYYKTWNPRTRKHRRAKRQLDKTKLETKRKGIFSYKRLKQYYIFLYICSRKVGKMQRSRMNYPLKNLFANVRVS